MPIQVRNPENVDLLSADFQLRYEPQFAWKSACSAFLALTGLRGFWPLSSFNESGNAYDLGGQGRILTYNGNPTYGQVPMVPLIVLDGTGDYLDRTGEAGVAITGTESYIGGNHQGLTLGGWYRFTNAAGSTEGMISRWNAGANERCYLLYRQPAGTIRFIVSNDGTATTPVATGTPAVGEWFFSAGRFGNAANEIKVWYNDDTNTAVFNNTIWPGTLANSADLVVGGTHGGGDLMTGRLSLQFLCAAALPDAVVGQLFQQTRAMFGI